MSTIFRVFLGGLLALYVSGSFAVENEKDEKYFYDSCQVFLVDATNSEAQACSDYMHGFLEGARMVESLFIDHLEQENSRREGFSERAYRTRVGQPEETELDRPSAPFCLPDSEFNADVLENLMKRVPDSANSLVEMDQLFFEALKEEYPCV